MATLEQHQSTRRAKILVVGDPKSGKTSALAGLANNGMRLFILDFDDNLAILRQLVKPEYHKNVIYETLRDRVRVTAKGPQVEGMPQAFARAIQLLVKWGEYGPVEALGENDVLVIDTLTHMGAAAMWYTLYANNKMGKRKSYNDWGRAMERQEGVIQMLTATEVKCNVVVNAHLTLLANDDDAAGDEDEPEEGQTAAIVKPIRRTVDYKRYPSALGKKLPPRIASYFDTVVQTKVIGAGPNARRVIRTVPEPDVDIAVPVLPGKLKPELSIENGLWQLIQAIRGDVAPTSK